MKTTIFIFIVGILIYAFLPQADITLTLSSTSKQIIISYTAPDTSPCTIEVSESATYSPVIDDVNNSLFSGSNSDDRSGSIGIGTVSRTFVVGTIPDMKGLITNLASDSNRYGRALQPNTTHYIRVTCGTHTGTGTISTKNRPLGITRNWERPMASAGVYAYPTITDNRDQIVSDPATGIKIRKLSNPVEDTVGGEVTSPASGAPWIFSQSTLNDSSGTPGYIATLPTNGGSNRIYFVTDTASRFLGSAHLYGGVITDFGSATYFEAANPHFGTDPRKLYYTMPDSNGEAHVIMCYLPVSGSTTYDNSVASGADAPCNFSQSSDLTPNPNTLTDQALVFDNTFVPANFGFGNNNWVQGNYLHFTALSGVQDTYGWVGSIDLTTSPATLVAFMPLWKRGGASEKSFRWCGIHTAHPALGTNFISFTAKTMYQDIIHSNFHTTLNGAINDTQMTITFASNTPLGRSNSVDPPVYNENIGSIQEGDEINLRDVNGIREAMYLGSFISGTTWNIAARGQAGGGIAKSHPDGTLVLMGCRCHNPNDLSQGGPAWWDFLTDPHGNDTTGTYLITQLANVVSYSGHEAWANNRGIAETGYAAFIGPAMTNNTIFTISDSPAFAGITYIASGNSWQKHQTSTQQTNADSIQSTVWGVDMAALDNDPATYKTSLTNVTGSLWKYVNANYPTLHRKELTMLAVVGAHPLLDVSGIGSSIGGTSGDNYKYCVANVTNECVTGSAAGDIYINAPDIDTNSSCIGFTDWTNTTKLCFGHIPAVGGIVNQIGIVEANSTGKWYRALTDAIQPPRLMNPSADSHPLPNGRWTTAFSQLPSGHWIQFLVKVPQWPGYDSIDRNTFIQKSITIPPFGGATEALIEFGYDTNFYCTSRNEKCVAAASNNPYFFNSESFTAVSCAAGCTIDVPVIPDRVAYYQIKWRDSSHNVVQTQGAFLAIEDSAPIGGGSGITKCNWNTNPSCQ